MKNINNNIINVIRFFYEGFGDHKKSQKKLKKILNNNLKEQIIYKAFKFHSEEYCKQVSIINFLETRFH